MTPVRPAGGVPPEMHRRSAFRLDSSHCLCCCAPATSAEPGMRALTLGTAAVAAMALAGCVAQKAAPPAPVPAPIPPPAPVPAPPPPPPPPPQDWRDIALTPGDWTYRPEPGGSVAEFGSPAPAFLLRCLT